jgi:hypothetical protein
MSITATNSKENRGAIRVAHPAKGSDCGLNNAFIRYLTGRAQAV